MHQEEIYTFADDSITDEGIVCAAIILGSSRLAELELLLSEAKKSVGIPADEPLHCRVLFAHDARQRTRWKNVEPADIFQMLQGLCQAIKCIELKPVVCLIDRALVKPQFPAPGLPPRMPTEKEVASLAYAAVATHVVMENRGHEVKMWIDPDSTRIPWGAKRSRADRTRTTLWVNLSESQHPLRVEAKVADIPKPVLLEIADLYAYVTVQAHSGRGGHRVARFKQLFEMIDPTRLRFRFPQEPEPWQDV